MKSKILKQTKAFLLTYVLTFVFGCTSHVEEGTANSTSTENLEWFHSNLLKINEPQLHERSNTFRLILSIPYGHDDYVIGIVFLGDQFLVYEKRIDGISYNFKSESVLVDAKEFMQKWEEIILLFENLIITQNDKNKVDSLESDHDPSYFIELNKSNRYLNVEGNLKEKVEVIKSIYEKTSFDWPLANIE